MGGGQQNNPDPTMYMSDDLSNHFAHNYTHIQPKKLL